jgi:hypothetical protein
MPVSGCCENRPEYTGLVDGVTAALIGTYRGGPLHAPGRVFCDLATAIADGADAISGIAVLTDREELFGPVAGGARRAGVCPGTGLGGGCGA